MFLVIAILSPPFCLVLRAKHERPRVKVHGAWCFGHFLNIFILDEVAKHDSSAIIEIVALTLEDVACICLRQRQYMVLSTLFTVYIVFIVWKALYITWFHIAHDALPASGSGNATV